jgi:hypothetical protein
MARAVLVEVLRRFAARLWAGLSGARLGGWQTIRAVSVVILPLALLPWIDIQIYKELGSPLFRDAAMCQYSGWCLRHGVSLYGDVGAPDGPLIHVLHAALQIFAGISDRGCRRADLVLQLLGSGTMGALLAPRLAETKLAAFLQRLAWALLAALLWMTWYCNLGWARTIQRDAYYGLVGCVSLVLVHTSADMTPRRARVAAFIGGMLAILMIFSRHSGLAIPACAAISILLTDDAAAEKRRLRWRAALAGGAAGLLFVLLLLLLFGSLRGFVFWYLRYPFAYYRWVGKQSFWGLLAQNYPGAAQEAVLGLVGVVVAVATKAVARRTLALAFPGVLFLIAACLMGKGWPNHIDQVTAMTIPLELLALSTIWNSNPGEARWPAAQTGFAIIVLLFVSWRTIDTLHESPYYAMSTPQAVDSDILEAKVVGAYLKKHTAPDDRVFNYGHESHVPLDAERKPAIPYYANIVFNIEGVYKAAPPAPDQQPNAKQYAKLKGLQAEIAADACSRLQKAPPGAMVFLEGSLGAFRGVEDVVALCPPVADLLKLRYKQVLVPGAGAGYKVFLSKENAARYP